MKLPRWREKSLLRKELREELAIRRKKNTHRTRKELIEQNLRLIEKLELSERKRLELIDYINHKNLKPTKADIVGVNHPAELGEI